MPPTDTTPTGTTRLDMRRQHKLGMAAVLGLAGYTRTHLPRALHEMVQLRASELNGCRYCIDMHTTALAKEGEGPDRIDAAGRGHLPHASLSPAENAALALTEQLTHLDPETGVTDEVWDEAAAHFTPRELGDLVLGIATINVFNRINIATRMHA